jgi:hypothetical protein
MKKIASERNYRLIKKAHPRDIWGRRYKDPWYDDDRGANDEGWTREWCPTCRRKTEHESTAGGSYCVPCANRELERSIEKRRER